MAQWLRALLLFQFKELGYTHTHTVSLWGRRSANEEAGTEWKKPQVPDTVRTTLLNKTRILGRNRDNPHRGSRETHLKRDTCWGLE